MFISRNARILHVCLAFYSEKHQNKEQATPKGMPTSTTEMVLRVAVGLPKRYYRTTLEKGEK